MYKNLLTATWKHIPKYDSLGEMGTWVLRSFLQGYEQLETFPRFQNTFIWANQPFQSGNKKSQMWCGNQLERRLFVLECPLLWPNKRSPLWPLCPRCWLVSSVPMGPTWCFLVGTGDNNTQVHVAHHLSGRWECGCTEGSETLQVSQAQLSGDGPWVASKY